MKRNVFALMVIASLMTQNTLVLEAAEKTGREYLLFEEIPVVFTASKVLQAMERTTSVMTVITENEIRRSGARTLYELLKRVPGFFPSIQATWPLIASRGLIADGNDHILLLIDGHVQNSIIGQGFQQQDMLPVLEKVKRIEIIRGPGSVLWGSSAVLGIINIITKDGMDMEKDNKITVGYGDQDGMLNVNCLHSFRKDTVNGIVSLSYWQSKGYNRPGKTGVGDAWTKEDARLVKGNVEFPWGEIGDWPALDEHKEGYELYCKVNLDESNRLLGRVVESNIVYPWDSWMQNPGSDLTMRKASLSYQNNKELSNSFDLTSIASADILLQNRFPYYKELYKSGLGERRDHMQDQSNEEMAFGLEFIGNIDLAENNNLKIGTKGVRTKIGPNRDTRFDIELNVPVSTGSANSSPYLGVESGYDNNIAVYLEDTLSLNQDRTTLFAGCRWDYNDFREKKGVFLPRGGIIQSLNFDWTAKYVINTGYLRPNAVYSKTSGKIIDTTRGPNQDILIVDTSEKIISHDLQLYWKKHKNYAAATLFVMYIDNYISFDANNTPQGYKNLGDMRTAGLELEGRYNIGKKLSSYANYSYALAKMTEVKYPGIITGAITNDSDETLNYPQHIFNLGCDFLMNDFNSLNVNLNGWRNMPIVLPLESNRAGEFDESAGEMYLDMNYSSIEIFGSPFDLSVFVMNILNNTDPVGMLVNNGIWHPRGRNIGCSLSCKW